MSQKDYIEKIIERFNLKGAKPVGTPFANHFMLLTSQYPLTNEDRKYMAKVPYASAIGSLLYAMVCIRPDIAQTLGVVS